MLKNVTFIKIGQRLGVAHDRQSFSTKRAYVEWSYHENSNFFEKIILFSSESEFSMKNVFF